MVLEQSSLQGCALVIDAVNTMLNSAPKRNVNLTESISIGSLLFFSYYYTLNIRTHSQCNNKFEEKTVELIRGPIKPRILFLDFWMITFIGLCM